MRYVRNFGLTGYRIEFRHCYLDDGWSRIKIDGHYKVVTVCFTTGYPDEDKPNYCGPSVYAKHEALHLLLGQLYYLCRSRFISSHELDEAEESLVWKLEKLIGD